MALRPVLMLTFFIAATADHFEKRDANDTQHEHVDRGGQRRKRSTEAFNCLNDGDPCHIGDLCCNDVSGCVPNPRTGFMQCSPVARASSSCEYLPIISKCEFSGYDKNTPPAMALHGGQTLVKIHMRLKNIWVLDPKTGQYSMDFYIIQFWNDTRLAHNADHVLIYHMNEQIDAIWQSDLYFSNSVEEYRNDLLAPVRSLRVYPTGLVRLSQRMQVKVFCNANGCPLIMESYGHILSLMKVVWNEALTPNEVKIDSTIADLVSVTRPGYCYDTYDGREYVCLKFMINFKNGASTTAPDAATASTVSKSESSTTTASTAGALPAV